MKNLSLLAVLLLLSYAIFTPQLIAESRTIERENLPQGIQLHTLLHIVSSQEKMGNGENALSSLGIDPTSVEANELVELAASIEKAYPRTHLPPTLAEQEARIESRMFLAGEGVARWLDRIASRGGDPGGVLRAMLDSTSWGMSMSNIEDSESQPGRAESRATSSEGLEELALRFEAEFQRGVRAVHSRVPVYLEAKPEE